MIISTNKISPLSIEGIDIEEGIKNTLSEDVLIELLLMFRDDISSNVKILKESSLNDLNTYRITVHSLKSTCRILGIKDLGEHFFQHEQWAANNNTESILNDINILCEEYAIYLERLSNLDSCDVACEDTILDYDDIKNYLKLLIDSAKDFDSDTVEYCVKTLQNIDDQNFAAVLKLYSSQYDYIKLLKVADQYYNMHFNKEEE